MTDSIIFVATPCYAATASDAENIDVLPFGFVPAGKYLTKTFRVGNCGQIAISVTISSDDGNVQCPSGAYYIAPGAFTDTLSVTVGAPIDCESVPVVALLTATADNGDDARLVLMWDCVGANTSRENQSPDRLGNVSDTTGNVLDTLAVPIRLYRFDPLPYDPDDHRIFIVGNGWTSARSLNCRLSPTDTRWGYTASVQTISAVFQNEEWSSSTSFSRDNMTVDYNGSATLLLPPEIELDRQWALMHPMRGYEPAAQYKRTVYLAKIRSVTWVLQNVTPVYYGSDLAYWTCPLIPLSSPSNGNQTYFNPFSITYEYNSDRPYVAYSNYVNANFLDDLTDIPDPYDPYTYSQ